MSISFYISHKALGDCIILTGGNSVILLRNDLLELDSSSSKYKVEDIELRKDVLRQKKILH